MHKNILSISAGLLLAAVVVTNCGCLGSVATQGPYLGIAGIPIPVSPYFQKRQEDKFHAHERYERAPILGPITAGGPAIALDEPSDDEVMVALEKARPVQGGFPLLWEKQRNNVRIVKEPIADYVDPPRVVPLIGPAQLHHAHYKCSIYFSERTIVGWPIPHWLEDEDTVEVIYIDHNHFHMVGHVDPGVGSPY
jgi:hypothetical protein